MGETLVEWCGRSQDEQINQKVGLVYGNYRQSHRLGLITDAGYDSFQYALSIIPPINPTALLYRENPDFGLTPIAVDLATNFLAADPASATKPDFRVCGKPISYGGLLLSIKYFDATPTPSATHPTSTGSAALKPRPTGSANWPAKVTWLTKPEDVLKRLEIVLRGSGSSRLSDTEFFRILVSSLGLRQPAPHATLGKCKVQAFKVKSGKSLVRPHAISRGYPEKFCGVSASGFGSFGSTADNRDGRAGLPEALAFEADLDQFTATSSEFQVVANEISRLVDFTVGDPVNLEGTYPITDLHIHDDFALARRTMLRRLRKAKPNKPCSHVALGLAICPHHSTLTCP